MDSGLSRAKGRKGRRWRRSLQCPVGLEGGMAACMSLSRYRGRHPGIRAGSCCSIAPQCQPGRSSSKQPRSLPGERPLAMSRCSSGALGRAGLWRATAARTGDYNSQGPPRSSMEGACARGALLSRTPFPGRPSARLRHSLSSPRLSPATPPRAL